jgi:hypothetical protein
VGHDPDVPGLFECELARHEGSFVSGKKTGPSRAQVLLTEFGPERWLCLAALHVEGSLAPRG